MERRYRPLIYGGALLGIGLGGFLDSILLQEIFRLQNENHQWDGLLWLAKLVVTLIGVFYLWQNSGRADIPRSSRILTGAMVIGWGIFMFIEGSLGHILLEIHHTIDNINIAHQFYWDGVYLAAGMILCFIGKAFILKGKSELYF